MDFLYRLHTVDATGWDLPWGETVKAEFGAVDILINAAGGNHPSATTSTDLSFFDLSPDALRHVSELNLLGTILPC